MEKLFGDAAQNVEDGFYAVAIVILIVLGLFILGKFGRRGDKGGNPRR
jgi:hypothetical protein